jgi:hypothetical protein
MSLKSKRDHQHQKAKITSANKPRIRGIVILLLLKAILGIFLAGAAIQKIQKYADNPSYIIEPWALPVSYIALGLAGLSFVAAMLIMRYKKSGLWLGGALIILDLLLIIGGVASIDLSVLIHIFAFYYIYKYLTQQPERTFFT